MRRSPLATSPACKRAPARRHAAAPGRIAAVLAFLLPGLAAGSRAAGAAVPDGFFDQTVLAGLDQPTGLAFLPDGRLLFVEQRTGRVRLVVGARLGRVDPVLTVPNVSAAAQEEGLLGIAVDPGWPARPYLYVHYNYASTPRNIHISRFTLSGDLTGPTGDSLVADPASKHEILVDIPDSTVDHNGGTLRFGPDGMLYASIGDDLVGYCAAQDTSALRGRILRLDVSGLPAGPGGPPAPGELVPTGNPFPGPNDNARLTWALGLRNPFRFHVDPATGDLFIGDVGELTYEEIDWAPQGGLNYGWPFREGSAPGPDWLVCANPPNIPSYTDPILAFDRRMLPVAAILTAGRYRVPAGPGPAAFPAGYDGDLFYSDYYHGFLRRLRFDGSSWVVPPAAPGQPTSADWATDLLYVADILEAPDGALWYARQFNASFDPASGMLGRIARDTLAPVAVPAQGAARGVVLEPPRPNPARGSVAVPFLLGAPARVDLEILDLSGRRVRRVLAGAELGAGRHLAAWDGADDQGRAAPSGLYLLRLRAAGRAETRRLVLAR